MIEDLRYSRPDWAGSWAAVSRQMIAITLLYIFTLLLVAISIEFKVQGSKFKEKNTSGVKQIGNPLFFFHLRTLNIEL